MRRAFAAAVAALGLVLAFTSVADAAARVEGGFRGGFRGGVYGGGGFYRGGFWGPRFGIGVGFYDPFWWPWYDPFLYPTFYRPEVVVRYAPPAGYLPPPNSPPAQQYWYRCGNPEGYYPYVRQCNTGWEQVPAIPDAAPR